MVSIDPKELDSHPLITVEGLVLDSWVSFAGSATTVDASGTAPSITFVGSTSSSGVQTGATSRTLGAIGGTQVGDLMIAATTTLAGAVTLTAPSGWTRIRRDDGNASNMRCELWYKIATVSNDGGGTWSASTLEIAIIDICAYRTTGTTWVLGNSDANVTATNTTGGANVDIVAPSVTADSSTGQLLFCSFAASGQPGTNNAAGTLTLPSGTLSQRLNNGSTSEIEGVGDSTIAASAASGTRTANLVTTTYSGVSYEVGQSVLFSTDAVGVGETTLCVEDASDFQEDGGTLVITSIPASELLASGPPLGPLSESVGLILPYVSADMDTDCITLQDPLPEDTPAGTSVLISPLVSAQWASVQVDGFDDPLVALVPLAMRGWMPEGTRTTGVYQETATVAFNGADWMLLDIGGTDQPHLLDTGFGGGGGVKGSDEYWRNVLRQGADPQGISDSSAAFLDADALGPIGVPVGTYKFSADITLTSGMFLVPGAVLKPDSGTTITIAGPIETAMLDQIFDISAGGVIAKGGEPTDIPEVWIEWFGAVGDNTTNCDAAIDAALDFAGGAVTTGNWGRGAQTTVRAGPGQFVISTAHASPPFVGFRGSGMAETTFICDAADAQIGFGNEDDPSRGTTCGDFTINAARVALTPVKIAKGEGRTTQNIQVYDAMQESFLIVRTQNSTFTNLKSGGHLGWAITFDKGCGNLKFFGGHLDADNVDNTPGLGHIRFIQTADDSIGFSQPTQIYIYGFGLEAKVAQPIYIGVGKKLVFDNINISSHYAGESSFITVRFDTISTFADMDLAIFRNLQLAPAGAGNIFTVLDGQLPSDRSFDVYFDGHTGFGGSDFDFSIDDHINVWVTPNNAVSGTYFQNAGTGNDPQDVRVRSQLKDTVFELTRELPDELNIEGRLDDDPVSTPRWNIAAGGNVFGQKVVASRTPFGDSLLPPFADDGQTLWFTEHSGVIKGIPVGPPATAPPTVTHLIQGTSGASGTSFTTASVTFDANSVALVSVLASKTGGGAIDLVDPYHLVPTVSGAGLDWVWLAGRKCENGTRYVELYAAQVTDAGASGTLSITYTASADESTWIVDQTSPGSFIRNVVSAANDGTTTSVDALYPFSFADPTYDVGYAVGITNENRNLQEQTGWTELGQKPLTALAGRLQTQYHNGSDTDVSVSTPSGTSDVAIIGVELGAYVPSASGGGGGGGGDTDEYIDLRALGATFDGSYYAQCSMTSGSAVLTGITFDASMIGKTAVVMGCGPGGATLLSTVTGSSGVDIVLADAASTTPTDTVPGAVGTDDSAAYTAANALISYTYGAKPVRLGRGVSLSSVGLTHAATIYGYGKRSTLICAIGNMGGPMLQLGGSPATDDQPVQAGPVCNFTLNGMGLAHGGILVGKWTNGLLQQVEVQFTASTYYGVRVAHGQNSKFLEMIVQKPGGDCLDIDTGAGGHSFDKCEFSNSARGATTGTYYNLVIRQISSDGPYTVPADITFRDCIFERGEDAPIRSGSIYIGNCQNKIVFDACNIGNSGHAGIPPGEVRPAVTIIAEDNIAHTSGPDHGIVFLNCISQGVRGHIIVEDTDADDITDSMVVQPDSTEDGTGIGFLIHSGNHSNQPVVVIDGGKFFHNAATFVVDDNATIDMRHRPLAADDFQDGDYFLNAPQRVVAYDGTVYTNDAPNVKTFDQILINRSGNNIPKFLTTTHDDASADSSTSWWVAMDGDLRRDGGTVFMRESGVWSPLGSGGSAARYIVAAGRTVLRDSDFSYTPSDGTFGMIHNTDTSRDYICWRAQGTWVSVEAT